ncbi:secreted RxLR effector protein 161-like [Zingiber officinale]|uniref:secreted RxLR effector protein 161-like n=1 Tax=Zingiber officinale TaxID=94328 RepID=UPI001C4AC488|nr:secreted RxLR effector protein 161-like [Zingiber officinale]
MNEANPVVFPTDYKGAITSITGREKPDVAIYRGIVGNLIYLSHTRPDLSFLVNLLSRYMSQPTSAHLAAAKRALKYVKGTMDLGLFFPATGDNESFTNLEGYSDSDYAGAEDAKSTSGYIFYLNNAPFSWSTKKQDVVAQSTAEAEFIAAALARNQCTWIRQLLSDIGFTPEAATPLMIDNQAAIAIAKDPTHFS